MIKQIALLHAHFWSGRNFFQILSLGVKLIHVLHESNDGINALVIQLPLETWHGIGVASHNMFARIQNGRANVVLGCLILLARANLTLIAGAIGEFDIATFAATHARPQPLPRWPDAFGAVQ